MCTMNTVYLIGLREGYEDGVFMKPKRTKQDYIDPLIQSDEISEWKFGYEDGYARGIVARDLDDMWNMDKKEN